MVHLETFSKTFADNYFLTEKKFIPIRIERRKIYRFFRYLVKYYGREFLLKVGRRLIDFLFTKSKVEKRHFYEFFSNTNKNLVTLVNTRQRKVKSKGFFARIFASIKQLINQKFANGSKKKEPN